MAEGKQKSVGKAAPGDIIGSPPSLEWISVNDLHIDASYQRTAESPKSRKMIAGMVKRWDWRLCSPLVVTRRETGEIFVLDGQHRLLGAQSRGDVPHLPCTALPAMPAEDEAAAFVDMNTQRQRLSQIEIFSGMLAAGDPNAIRTAAVLRETGWTVARHTNTANYKPGELASAPMISRRLKRLGEVPVRNALATLREAFPDRPVRTSAKMLEALFVIFSNERFSAIDPDDLVETLGAVEDPRDWLASANDVKRDNPASSMREAMVESIVSSLASVPVI